MRPTALRVVLLLALLAAPAATQAQANLTSVFPDLAPSESRATALREENLNVTPAGYAVDEGGEIYAVDTFSGAIFKLTPA